eukprot:scaffold1804_cov263-Pinguiococcus_pyrenoidosus.AAC.16
MAALPEWRYVDDKGEKKRRRPRTEGAHQCVGDEEAAAEEHGSPERRHACVEAFDGLVAAPESGSGVSLSCMPASLHRLFGSNADRTSLLQMERDDQLYIWAMVLRADRRFRRWRSTSECRTTRHQHPASRYA